MGTYKELSWNGNPSGPNRTDRRSCRYRVYCPDLLKGQAFRIDAQVVLELVSAERSIQALNTRSGVGLRDMEGLARLLLRGESIASSRIEGLQLGARKLLRAELANVVGSIKPNALAAEILANINAMETAIQSAANGEALTVPGLKEIHRRLMSRTGQANSGGQLREKQNWIGGSNFHPCAADFVPPPPDKVPALLEDLCQFLQRRDIPAVLQAAVGHAQFETIHPFADGNGRTGRALIHHVFRVRDLSPRLTPPVSLVLATQAKEYVHGLMQTRYEGAPTGEAGGRALNDWVLLFAKACQRAVQDIEGFEQRIEHIQTGWRRRLGTVRADSAVDRLLPTLVGLPVITVDTAAAAIRRSFPSTNDAVEQLEKAGILFQVNMGKRNRAFEAKEIVQAFSDLERGMASPLGDTRLAPPSRPVPPLGRPGRRRT